MSRPLAAAGIFLLMLALGAADAVYIEGWPGSTAPSTQIADRRQPASQSSASSRKRRENLPPGAVPKQQGPDVLQTLRLLDFTPQQTDEPILLRDIVPEQQASVPARVLLKDGDRAGIVAWIQSPQVKEYYLSLKEALHGAFTPKVRDLLDETQRREGKPTRNLLTFYDPGIAPERLVFIRVRERLFEFHIAEGRGEAMFELIETLTQ